MADYQAQIRLGIEGLGQLQQLERRLENATTLLRALDRVSVNIDQAAESASRRVSRAGSGIVRARQEVVDARAARLRGEGGRFVGADLAARRKAEANYRLAEIGLQQEARALREINEQRRRYAARLGRATRIIDATVPGVAERRTELRAQLRNIGTESRANYLTNLFQGRQREFARGGGGANLSTELQQQARNVRAAFDLASASGREGLGLMQRLATEMAGIVRQQNEMNRTGAGRSSAFESARRGQERLDALAARPGVSDQRISRMRAQAASVIEASNRGDIAGARDLARRMNASIMRYTRELDAAARDLQQQQRAGFRNLNVRQSWATGLEQLGETATAVNQRLKVARTNQRASWTTALEQLGDTAATINQRLKVARTNQRASWATGLEQLGETATVINQRLKVAKTNQRASWAAALEQLGENATTISQRLKVARTNQRASWATSLEQLGETAAVINQRLKVARTNQRASWATALEQLGETATAINQRLGARNLNVRQSWAAVLQDIGAEQQIRARALPDRNLLAQRVAASGQVAPTRLDDLRDAARKAEAEAEKRAAGSTKRYADAVEREAKRLERLGIGQGPARGPGGAIPMGGQSRGGFNQLPFPAGPGNARGIAQFQEAQRQLAAAAREQQKAAAKQLQAASKAPAAGPGFFRGDPRKAFGEGLIGGAFPLLFGQGLGASIGGAAGGVSGGLIGGSFGFGLSLIGTALGQVVDTAVNKLGTLGGALSNATESMAALEQAGFRVRDSQKIQIAQLEKVGQGYEAQKVVLKEIESRLGPGSVQQIERLNEAQKELSDAWAQLSLQLGTTLIPVIIEAANFINDLLGGRRPSNNASAPTPNKPRKPSDVLADLDALVAGNERNKAANREYAGLVREVEDFRRENEEKIFTMRRQAADIEKQKSDLRLEVEGRIFDMRQESARLEIENARSRAQIATESFDLQLAQQADALGGRGGEFVDQVREYLRIRETGEADLQAKEKTTKLQIAAQERELQVYILQVSDKVAAIARTVEDYKRDQAKFRFETSRRLEDYRIKAEDYIFARFKERYEYAIGSEQEILRLRMEAAAQMGVGSMPPDAAAVLGGVGTGRTEVGRGGLASPVGAQISGRPPNWNQGLGAGRGHRGQDIGVDVGTTIHAMEDAVVDSIIRGFGEVGDAVVLRYRNSGNLGVYGHINPAAGIVPGQAITAGQQIGVVTPDLRSGGRNNTHLHYEYWRRTRGPAANLLDPSERLRGAIYNRRPTAPSPVTQSQTRQAPRMLLPPAAGPTPQMFAPATTDSMFERRSSLQPDLGESLLSQIQQEGGFEDIAMSVKDARMIINKVTQEATKGNISPDAFVAALSGIGDFAQSPDFSRRAIRNMMATPGARAVVNTPGLAPMAIKRLMATHGKAAKAEGVNPAALDKHIGPMLDLFNQMKRDNLLRSNVSLEETRAKLQLPLYQALMGWVKENMNNPAVQGVLSKSRFGKANSFSYGAKGLVPSASGFDPKAFGVPPTPAALKAQQEYEKRKAFEASPEGRRQAEAARKYAEEFRRLREDIEKNVIRKKGAMLPDSGFDMASLSKLGTEYAPVAQLGPAPPPLALPGPGQPIPHSMRVDAPSSVTGLQVVPFTGNLPTYQPAPVATPTPPAAPQLPAAPAPMAPIDTSALTKELGKQRDELLENIELLKKLQDLENGRLLLQLGSTREVRNRLEDAAREYNLGVKLLGVNTSLSQNEQERAAERIRTALATEDLNTLEQQTLGFAKELLDAKKLEQQEYDQITRGIQDRITYEKELLQLVEDRAEVARQEAFLKRAGEVRQQINLTGAGLRSGLIGTGARAFEAEMAISGNMDQAKAMAELSQRLEDQQLIWGNLEKNIVDVSNAISGGLTNGLLDVISGAKKIEDVGREVLDGIARTFADTAQQQLSALMQRKLASMLGGPEGPLTKMLGGASAAAGPQALGAASFAASNSVAAFGIALDLVAARMGVSGALSGFGSAAAGGIGSAFSAAAPNILGSFFPGASPLPSFPFGGFLANGGTAVAGKGYVVGENEPEFFFPGVTGRVVPRSDMEKAAALQEGESSNEPIDIRYTVTEQRGERYVTEEQFRKGMASTSKRTQAMTYAGMRNSKQVREYTGI